MAETTSVFTLDIQVTDDAPTDGSLARQDASDGGCGVTCDSGSCVSGL